MLSTLILKELRFILSSPKFVAMFAVCAALLLLSVFVGIREFESSTRAFETATGLVDQEIREARQWSSINNRVFRRPDPMQIFASGVEFDIGRVSAISSWTPIKLSSSMYSNDPIYALFRSVDFVFIVSVVLTLFALLFSYDGINGEREQGTLRLVLSNAIPRGTYILAKFVGSWMGLVVPLLVPLLLSLMLVMVSGVPMTGEHWVRVGMLIGSSLLLFTFFLALGLFVSATTSSSNVSFLVSLTAWIALVLIVPRAGVMIAGQIISVPSVAEMESRQDSFAKDRWESHMTSMDARWRERRKGMESMTKEQQAAYREEKQWEWAEEDDRERKLVQKDIDENARILQEDLRNRKREQEKLAFTLSRFSPVSAFHLSSMNLAGTDVGLKSRYEDAMQEYRTTFNAYKDTKQKESGSSGGIRISIDTDSGIKIDTGREIALNVSDMPKFDHPRASFGDIFASIVVDIGVVGVFSLLAFAGAFVGFLRYDVR